MAKAKKAKNNEEQKGGTDDSSNSEAIVKHQKLCLSIDMENRRIYGYTELQMVVPENGIVGLYADNLAIERVTVDGEPAVFENYPHYEHREPKDWAVVSSATSAADASGSVYLSSLDFELLPNLLIMCSQSSKPDNKQQECMDMENGEQLSADQSRLTLVQNVRHVRIEYWVEKAETGIHFDDDVLHTDSQLRRARCWFPCMDDSFQCCCYDLEFTVASNLVAISSGTLVHQVLTNESPPRKTYVYKLDVPVAAQWISLAVAPVEIVSDRHGGQLSHFCQPANLPKLRNTVVFFYNAFSHYEDYLSASFPFGSYRQVFIAPEMALSSCSVGASMSIFSSHLLFDEKIIDQTIETRTKLAYALARQWFGVYITPEAPNDEWLLDGLAGFLTDSFIKRSLGNNEARYRRYKANCAVCQADDSGATALSSSAASKDLYGTQCIGFYGKIRSWKSVAVLQMLEKQMGPESFRKILQTIILRARDGNRPLRTLSTKEFRHFANKIGNLERPFLKEFFPRWIESCGCPVLKMGFSFNKRKNLVELAVHRDCTFRPDTRAGIVNHTSDSENHETGWPGMMSIRVHELDGMYDHPILPMAGEPWQLLEIQCHSKLAAKRVQKPKKGTKADGSDDNAEAATTDLRLNSDSPLMWLRADPEMEYLAEVHFNQPTQMWINQLEKDKDVIAQAQVISVLESLPQLTFSVVNALNNFLRDSKAFWRVRVQAAYALATTTTEDTDWAGLLHLINFYKSRRFDPNIGLPRPNDFHDIQEYFVLEAIPHAIALVRHSDNKSPREAVEFILQLLKYNDNNGNTYSDVFWLAALVRAVGELEFGLQSIVHLPSLLKRLDRLLQFDRLMPSHNGILTVSCIRTLTQIALKLSEFVPLDSVINLIKPYRGSKTWQIRIDASRALLELEFQSKGINAALSLFIRYLKDDMCIRGQTKLGVCALRLSQMDSPSNNGNDVQSETLVALLRELESPIAFNNITLRHYIFCMLQVLAGRPPTLFGVPRDEMGHSNTSSELKSFFAAVIKQKSMADGSPALAPDLNTQTLLISEGDGKVEAHTENNNVPGAAISPVKDASVIPGAALSPVKDASVIPGAALSPVKDASVIPGAALSPVKDASVIPGAALSPVKDASVIPVAESIPDSRIETNLLPLVPVDVPVMPPVDVPVMPPKGPQGREPVEQQTSILVDNSNNVEASVKEEREPMIDLVRDGLLTGGSTREIGTVTNGNEVVKKPPKLKIRVKQSAQVSNDTTRIMSTHDRPNDGADHGESSSVSVTASRRNFGDNIAHNLEDANSGHDIGSRLTASIGSAKPTADEDELLQCTADSSKVSLQNTINDTEPQTSGHTYTASVEIKTEEGQERSKSGKEKRKDKERKRKRSDKTNEADDSERKRQKKEKKRKKKELAKLMATSKPDNVASVNLPIQVDPQARPNPQQREQPLEIRGDATHGDVAAPSVDELHRSRDPGGVQVKAAEPVQPNVGEPASASSAQNTAPSHKIKIKFKSRTLGKP